MKQIFTALIKSYPAHCLAICFLLFTTATSWANTHNAHITGNGHNTSQLRSATAPLVYGSRLYVAQGASGDGSAWNNALGDLSSAINIASGNSSITEIWVKSGTYYPSTKPYGASTAYMQDNAFTLVNGVTIYGGFAGTETDVLQRIVNANPTILSGDIGTPNDNSDNCYHVVVSINNDNTAVLDGFTITGGNAINPNFAIFAGVPVLGLDGGGLTLFNSSALITNCTITGNIAGAGGGGLFQIAGNAKISRCIFSGNSAAYGGAVRNESTPSLTIINCVFSGNNSQQSGAALSLYLGSDTLAGNLFIKNYDHGLNQGGGVMCLSSANFYIADNTFFADTTTGKGGAIDAESSSGSLQLYNNIFWKNYGAQAQNDVSNVMVNYTQSSNSFGNINPLFVNENDPGGADNIWATADDGMNLQFASPAFDAGDNSKVPAWLATDIAGRDRILSGIVNLGAYEGGKYTYTTIYVDSSVTVAGDGGTWATAFKTMSDAVKTAGRFSNIDSILVAKGTYYPTGSQSGTARDSAFVIVRGGLKMYGGYASGGGTRNIHQYPTYLDGDINIAGNSADNSYHVMVISNIGSGEDNIVVDGFTFRNGSATDNGSKVNNGVSLGNSYGGALALTNVNSSNKAQFTQCSFINNQASAGGGALFQSSGTAQFIGCVFTNNNAYYGGAVRNENNPYLVIISSVFSGNISAQSGGAMSLFQGQGFILNDLFIKNRDNSTTQGGGALSVSGGYFTVTNNTFYADTTNGQGGAVRAESVCCLVSLVVNNNIFYKNYAAIADTDVHNEMPNYDVSYNSYSNANPLFVNEADGDGPDNIWGTADDGFSLLASSPAFDAGNNADIPWYITTDITGAPRVQNGTVNLGAYEDGSYPYTTLYVDSSVAVSGNGSTWATALKTLGEALSLANRAPNVNTIRVARGTYYPTGTQNGTNRFATFLVARGGLKVYGCYPNGGGTRNYNLYPTFLDGNINTAGSGDNICHLLVIAGIGSGEDSIVVDGFTLRNGVANSGHNSTINDADVTYVSGGGAYLTNVNNGQKTLLRHCTFSNNTAQNGGGALMLHGSLVVLNGCVFSNNSASYGGAIRTDGNSIITALNSVFAGNVSTAGGGGAMSLSLGKDTLINNLFVKNRDNSTTQGGGALCTNSGDFYIVNNTFYADSTNGKGGAIGATSTTGTLGVFNNVFYKNSSLSGNSDVDNITTLYTQANNSFGITDPLFVNEANLPGADGIWATGDDGLKLKATSPLINGGDNSKLPPYITTDISGANRIADGTIDIGAFENKIPVAAAVSGDTIVCLHSTAPRVLFTGSKGTAPYTFSYTLNGGGSHNLTTVTGDTASIAAATTAGTFVYKLVSVKDKAGNTQNIGDSITIVVKQGPSATLAPAGTEVCYGAHAFISVTQVKNGTQPYKYSIDGGTTYQDTVRFNVGTGTYSAIVKDSVGCTVNTNTVTVTQPADSISISAHPSAVSCGNNNITVNATGGWGSFVYSINGGTYQAGNVINNVGTGTKTLHVKDVKGCAKSTQVVITPLSATAATGTMVVCYNAKATITVKPKNGTPPYQYSIDGGATYQDTAKFVVNAGSYTITVKDSVGCTTLTNTVNIIQPLQPLSLSETHTNVTCHGSNDGSITVTGNGGFGNYMYSLNTAAYDLPNVFNNLTAATYTVHVKDARGCTAGKTVVITQPTTPCFAATAAPVESSEKSIKIALKLSLKAYPNPSPVNFTLVLSGCDEKAPVELRVMDINGKAVYQAKGTVQTQFSFGQTFSDGVYVAEVLNGNNMQTIKLIKMR